MPGVSVAPSLHGLFAGVLVSVLAYFPFLYLPVAASLRGLDPVHEDVAASLGLTPCRVFFRVVLPQLRLAIWGGGLLLALHLLSEYGLYAMVRFDTFTTAIFDQFQSTFNGPAATRRIIRGLNPAPACSSITTARNCSSFRLPCDATNPRSSRMART
jgi:iron(III) transport system permease protein